MNSRTYFCGLLFLGASAFAQVSPIDHTRVHLGLHIKIASAVPYSIRVASAFGNEAPPLEIQTFANQQGLSTPVMSPELGFVAKPGTVYTVIVGASSSGAPDIQFNVAPGYRLALGECGGRRTERTTIQPAGSYNGSWYVDFSVEDGRGQALRPGFSTNPRVDQVGWEINLGQTEAGISLGVLRWRQDAVTDDLLDSAALTYADAYGGGVFVGRNPDDSIASVTTYGLWVMVRRNAGSKSGYQIECFKPGVATTPHTGFREYTVSNPDATWQGRVSLEIATRNPDCTVENESWLISQIGNVRQVHQSNGARRVKISSVPGPGTNERTETVTVDSGSGSQAVRRSKRLLRRLYVGTYLEREELVNETLDPTSYPLDDGTLAASPGGKNWTTEYTYFESESLKESFGKLRSISRPDGSWEAYRYYGASATEVSKWGQVAAIYRPWQDNLKADQTPLAPGDATDINCHATLLDYSGERAAFCELPSRRETRVLGVTVGLTEVSYAWSTFHRLKILGMHVYGYQEEPLRIETIKEYANASAFTTRVRKAFGPTASREYAGRLVSEIAPDGTKVSVTEYLLWGGQWVTYTCKGSAGSLWGTPPAMILDVRTLPHYNVSNLGVTIDPVYMVAERSALTFTRRDSAGRVIESAYRVFPVSAYPPYVPAPTQLWSETMVYSDTGELLSKTGLAGTWSGTYKNGKLQAETKETGVKFEYEYDDAGRRTKAIQLEVPVSGDYPLQPAITEQTTYDAAGSVIAYTRTAASLLLASSATFDLAGTVASSTDERGSTTATSYQFGGRVVQTNLPNGATVLTEHWRDGGTKKVSGSGAVAKYMKRTVVNTGPESGYIKTTTYVGTDQDSGLRWNSKVTDWLGRTVREESPSPQTGGGTFAKTYEYNALGQVSRSMETGLAATLHTYDDLGAPYRSALDVDQNGVIGLGTSDRVTEQTVRLAGCFTERRFWEYQKTGDATSTLTATELQHLVLPGTFSKTDRYGNTAVGSFQRSAETVTDVFTVVYSDSSASEVTVVRNGLVRTRTNRQGHTTTFNYDALGRLVEEYNPRMTQPARMGYHVSGAGAIGQVAWKEDAAGNRTQFSYHPDGRVRSETDPLQSTRYFEYDWRDNLLRTWGTGTYPVEHAYDAYGDRVAMRTFRVENPGFATSTWPNLGDAGSDPLNPNPALWTEGQITRWRYDESTGVLRSKIDHPHRASNTGTDFTYDARGNTLTREWLRANASGARIKSTYGYDARTGELTSVLYNDGTANVGYTYNRLGQIISVSRSGGNVTATTTALENSADGRVIKETLDANYFGGRALTRTLALTGTGTRGRISGIRLAVDSGTPPEIDLSYSCDSFGRLTQIRPVQEPFGFNYYYLENSNLIASVSRDDDPQGYPSPGPSYLRQISYEASRDVITEVRNSAFGQDIATVAYQVDSVGRRTHVVRSGASYARYPGGGQHDRFEYNARSEVARGRSWFGTNVNDESAAQLIAGRDFQLAYDGIGNRTVASADSRVSVYGANDLNQYTSRTTAGAIFVSGLAGPAATVNVNSAPAAGRSGDFFYSTLTVDNSTGPVWAPVQVTAGSTQSVTRNAFVPRTPEAFSYDDDGNIVRDGRWEYSWDAENRLRSMVTYSVAVAVGVPQHLVEFEYDHQHRRIRKRVRSWSGSAYSDVSDRRYVYDGWNLVAELDQGAALKVRRTYFWGLDLTHSSSAAGGVGALLQVRDWTTGKSFTPTYDGNGNVIGLVEARSGEIAAAYEYGPYGEVLRSTGSMAAENPFRFSTKFVDDETGLVYYGRRYYSPSQGRFLGRDPIQEEGGLNLYGFCGNNSINRWDLLGMAAKEGEPAKSDDDCEPGLVVWNGIAVDPSKMDDPQYINSLPLNGANPSLYGGTYTVGVSSYGGEFATWTARSSVVAAPNSVTSFYSPGSDSWVGVGPSGQSTPTIADRGWDQQVANGEFDGNAQIVTGIVLNAAASALPALSLGKAAVTAATPLILQNAARGCAFETAALNALGAAKNTTRVTVPGLGSSVPDVIAAGAITEVKNVANLSFTRQLRIQVTASQGPFNLIVSPTTQSISRPLVNAVTNSGGTIRVFNPVTGTFSPWP